MAFKMKSGKVERVYSDGTFKWKKGVGDTLVGTEKSNKTFNINSDNYSWSKDSKGTMEVTLGNMTDAGWYWNGNQNDLNGFLFRLNNSTNKDKFLEDTKKEGITFSQIKPQLLKAVDKGDGFYEMSGDNAEWKFGSNEDVDSTYEMEEAGVSKEQQDEVYKEYDPVKYEEFEKDNLKSFKEDMKKAVKESESYEELMAKQEEINQDLIEKRVSENEDRFRIAIDKVKENK